MEGSVTRSERLLYHQIHPLKLATDWATGAISYALLWRRQFWPALFVQLVPALAVCGALIRWADLEPQRRSAFGHYVERSMTPAMQGLRLASNVVMSLGAWYRRPGVLASGSLLILFGWLRGRLFPKRGS